MFITIPFSVPSMICKVFIILVAVRACLSQVEALKLDPMASPFCGGFSCFVTSSAALRGKPPGKGQVQGEAEIARLQRMSRERNLAASMRNSALGGVFLEESTRVSPHARTIEEMAALRDYKVSGAGGFHAPVAPLFLVENEDSAKHKATLSSTDSEGGAMPSKLPSTSNFPSFLSSLWTRALVSEVDNTDIAFDGVADFNASFEVEASQESFPKTNTSQRTHA